MKKLIFILICMLFVCCINKNDTNDICDCYTKSLETNIDIKLNNCLGNQVDGKNVEESKTKLKALTKSLIQNCPKYQSDFNKLSFYRFETGYPKLVTQKDSLIKCVENNIEKAKNLNNLAEIYIRLNDLEIASRYVNMSIELEPNISHSHWVKSYIFQKKNDFPNAVKEMKKAEKFSENSDAKYFNELLVLNLIRESEKK